MVLNCAARHGDPELARAVLDYLAAEPDMRLDEHHYAALIEACAVHCPPLPADIFAALAAMRAAAVLPTRHTAAAAVRALGCSRETAAAAAAALPVPAEIDQVDVVLAALVRAGDLHAAMQLYIRLPALLAPALAPVPGPGAPTQPGPTTTTFNILLAASPYPLAQHLVAEMRAMRVLPDARSYDALICACIAASSDPAQAAAAGPEGLVGPRNDAFLYLEEMRRWCFRLPQRTYEKLLMACLGAEDLPRARLLLREMEAVPYPVNRPRRWIQQAEQAFGGVHPPVD